MCSLCTLCVLYVWVKEEKEEGWKRIETANGLLTDPGPTYSVLNTNQGKLNQETINVVGATGKLEKEIFFNPINFKFNKQWLTCQFLYAWLSGSSFRKRPIYWRLRLYLKMKKYSYWYPRLKPLRQGLLCCREHRHQTIVEEYQKPQKMQ